MVSQKQKDHIATIPTQVRNYLLENSPSASFITDLPQVSHKRSRQQVHDETRAKKVTKLQTENKQPETGPGDENHQMPACPPALMDQEAARMFNLQTNSYFNAFL
ncbi:hypothetical protein M8C21_031327 [Ambrosia artemisiifolia]|uniref:Uncharacterized protein n=1 Tax=Ambrosia artemisiifolia TaxID=4212 RepID=A0AAD5GHN9_AMBAR|nr:hypothetical protein M8C21_031327 [Ambrosia artemisiifolia]